jgi:hypothetical protein
LPLCTARWQALWRCMRLSILSFPPS